MNNINLENYWNETTLKDTPSLSWEKVILEGENNPHYKEIKEYLDYLFYLPINEFDKEMIKNIIVNYNTNEKYAKKYIEIIKEILFYSEDGCLKEGFAKKWAEEHYKKRVIQDVMKYRKNIIGGEGSGNHTLAEVHKYFQFPEEIPDIYKK